MLNMLNMVNRGNRVSGLFALRCERMHYENKGYEFTRLRGYGASDRTEVSKTTRVAVSDVEDEESDERAGDVTAVER